MKLLSYWLKRVIPDQAQWQVPSYPDLRKDVNFLESINDELQNKVRTLEGLLDIATEQLKSQDKEIATLNHLITKHQEKAREMNKTISELKREVVLQEGWNAIREGDDAHY
jgi:predicted nuclease with TOPRIM domain